MARRRSGRRARPRPPPAALRRRLSGAYSQRARVAAIYYTASYTADLYVNQPPAFYSGTVSGLVSADSVDPFLGGALGESGGYAPGVPRIVPQFIGPAEVPEPGSLALLAPGAATRRKSLR